MIDRRASSLLRSRSAGHAGKVLRRLVAADFLLPRCVASPPCSSRSLSCSTLHSSRSLIRFRTRRSRRLFGGPETPDFSQLTWPDAFEKLNDHLSRAYAMGAWKRIDWKALHDVTAPKIADAERTGDRAAYYLALREYLWSLNDTHVDLSGHDGGLRYAAIKGGYGLQFVRLDDGRTINHVLIEGGPAASQGMEWGATILRWNGMAVDDAVARTSVLWSGGPGATHEGRRLARLRFLTRAPIGTNATVVFQNPDETTTRTATLVAVDDKFESLRLADLPRFLESDPDQHRLAHAARRHRLCEDSRGDAHTETASAGSSGAACRRCLHTGRREGRSDRRAE